MTTLTEVAGDVAVELDAALAAQVPVMLVYQKPGDEPPQHRLVSPSEVWEAKDSALILSAFDHGRDEPRSFRLDRIERVYEAPEGTDYQEMPTRD